MYDGVEVSNKEMAIMVLVCVVSLAVIFGAGYMFGLSHGKDVHDNGNGTEPISTELGQVGANIGNAESGIGQAENHAGNIEAGIGNAQESADYLQGTVSTSADIINQCKQIIAGIRQRGEAQKTKD